jgi:hypothetical protein
LFLNHREDHITYSFKQSLPNLCPLFGGIEFAGFSEDFAEAISEPIKAVSRRSVGERSPEHFHGVLSKEQRIEDTFQTRAQRNRGRLRLWR